MPCKTPPEIADMELLAYKDGDGQPGTGDHLAHCPYCREHLARLSMEEGRARRSLYRAACPKPQDLGEYQLHLLEAPRAKEIAVHLSSCMRCREELAALETYLRALAPDLSPSPVDRVRDAMDAVRVLVAQLVSGPLAPGPAYGLRGEAAGPVIYAADDIQVIVDSQEESGFPGFFSLLGITTGVPETGSFVAHLWSDDVPLASAPLDPAGNFTFKHLSPASYDLIITGPDFELQVPAVAIHGASPP